MSPSALLSALLLSSPTPPARASPPGLVDAAGDAWVVVHAGQPWVCWSAGPGCWRRINLDDASARFEDILDEDLADDGELEPLELVASAPEQWRFGFAADSASLWIERDDRRWRLDHGSTYALAVDSLPMSRMARPRSFECGHAGQRPAVVGGRLTWVAAPRCAPPPPSLTCVAALEGPRLRKVVPVRLRAGLELAALRGWAADDDDPASRPATRFVPRAGVELLFVVELEFDMARAQADERTRAAMLSRPRLRQLPTILEGPLAGAERRAQAEVICGGRP